MGEPEYIIIINDSQTYILKGNKDDVIKEAIRLFNKYWSLLKDDYSRASDEEKKQWNEEGLFGSDSEINLIRIFYKS